MTQIISEGLAHGLSKEEISKKIRKTINSRCAVLKLSMRETEEIRKNYRQALFHIWMRRKKAKTASERYKLIKEQLLKNKRIVHNKNVVANMYEKRTKDAYLAAIDSIFVVCTVHANPACGHKDYQGKIYYNEKYDWSDKRINNYIKRHKLISFQKVIDEPVYLVRRPNCRHRLISVKVEDVLSGNVKAPTVQNSRSGYDADRHRYYYELVKLLESLIDSCDCKELREDIRVARKKAEEY